MKMKSTLKVSSFKATYGKYRSKEKPSIKLLSNSNQIKRKYN